MGLAFARLETFFTFGAVILTGLLVGWYVFGFYQATPPRGIARLGRRWVREWDFSLLTLGGFSYARLALISLLGLFLELLMIRWISSELRIFAYFKNFVLVACFLGFGLGCYLCRRKINLLAMALPLVTLVLLVKSAWQGLRSLMTGLPFYLGASSEVHVWGVPTVPVGISSLLGLAAAAAVVVLLFTLIAFVFVTIGQMVGGYLESAPRGILAYSVNVLASLAGVLLYTLLCFFYQPPWVWFLLAGALLLVLVWRTPRLRWTVAVAFAVCLPFVTLGPGNNSVVYWSPYQKLTLTPREDAGKIVAYELNTNDAWFQSIVDLSPAFVAAHPQFFGDVPAAWDSYNIPYRFYPSPPSVLVLGAGMGNDVAASLRNGAGRVVAVEIDPLIVKLGRRLHFERPYSSPKVQTVVDDARSYVENSQERFDLIVFSLLDSHTNSSHYSNIRIDNYVYTREALTAAKRLLRDDGLFIIKFQVTTPWIAGRLYELVDTVFGRPPLSVQGEASRYTAGGTFFIAGSEKRIAQALSDPKLADYAREHSSLNLQKATLTTDDWPYFYQHEPGLPFSVIGLSGVLVLLCAWLVRNIGTGVRSVNWHFFFLGAGFMLLETQIISKMALLFGTTWVVNSLVISALMLLIVAANIFVEARPRIPIAAAYTGLFLSIVVSYLIPLDRLFFESIWVKALVATVLLCLPVAFASIVFIRSFALAGFSGSALGSNLIGALLGGLLDSLSLWTGIKSLLLIAAILYLASYFSIRQKETVPVAALAGESSQSSA